MKLKIIIIYSLFVVAVSGCRNSSDILQETSEGNVQSFNHYQEVELISNLEAFNDSLTNSRVIPNFNWDAFRTAVDITFSDLLGAAEGAQAGAYVGGLLGPNGAVIGASVGAPVVAAYRSYKASKDHKERRDHISITGGKDLNFDDCLSAYIYMKENCDNIAQFHTNKITLLLPRSLSYLQNWGIQHNIILANMINGSFSETPIYEGLSEFEYNLFTSEYLKNKCFVNYGNQYNLMLEKIDDAKLAKILNLFINAVVNSTSSYSELEFISNRYVSEIWNSSSLNLNQQTFLTGSICVGVYSCEYWNVYEMQ